LMKNNRRSLMPVSAATATTNKHKATRTVFILTGISVYNRTISNLKVCVILGSFLGCFIPYNVNTKSS
jgi:hypothetical protein